MLNKKSTILLLFIVAKFILQYLLIDNSYDLHRDEYLHLDQGKHLAWGFDSVPPFTSWISFIIGKLGNTVFWIKFFPALFGALTIVIVWKTVEKLGGNLFALVLSATAILLSVVLRLNILYQPNSFDVLAWTTVYYFLILYIQSEKNKWLYAAAIIFAVGFLNKYNIAFLFIGTLPAILLTKHRKVFGNRHLYFALFIALLIALPNLLWQFKNGLPVIHHMNELTETQLVNVKRSDFVKEQLLFFLGSFFIIAAAWISFFVFDPFKKFQVIFWSFVFTIALFIYLKAKGYYSIGLYPVLIAFGAAYLENVLSTGWKRYLKPVLLLIPVLLSITFIKIGFPTADAATLQHKAALYKKFGLLRWEDGKDHHLPQDFADMLGWSELAKKVDEVYDSIADKEHTLVYCDNYGQAGAINYYSKFRNINAVSMNADYIDWFPPASKEIKNVINVKDIFDPDTARTRERPLFESVILKGRIENPYAREKATCIYLFANARIPVAALLQGEISERKSRKRFFR